MFNRFKELLGSGDRQLADQAVVMMNQLPLDDPRFDPWIGRTGEGSHALYLLLKSKNQHLKHVIADVIKCDRGGEVKLNTWSNAPISYAELNTSRVERLIIRCGAHLSALQALTRATQRLTHLTIKNDAKYLFNALDIKTLAEHVEPLSGLVRVELPWISSEGLIELAEHPKLLSLLSPSLLTPPPQSSRAAILHLTPNAISALERCEALRAMVEVDQLTSEGLASLTARSPLLASFEARYAHLPPTPERRTLTQKALEKLPQGTSKKLKARLTSLGERALFHGVELEVLNTSSFVADPYSRRTFDLSMNMSLCPAGRFLMGAPDGKGRQNARPQHEVVISEPLWVSQVTLTGQQMLAARELGQQGGLDMTGIPTRSMSWCGEEPVSYANWIDAVYMCNLMSQIASLTPVYQVEVGQDQWGGQSTHVELNREADGYRLPSEAEWAYVARAQEPYLYAGADDLQEVAWFGAGPMTGNKRAKNATTTHYFPYPGGLKRPNAWGLYDLSGNMLEWCQDAWLEDAYAQRPDESPLVDPIVWSGRASHRVARGGHFKGGPILCELHHRSKQAESAGSAHCGLRLVRRAVEFI